MRDAVQVPEVQHFVAQRAIGPHASVPRPELHGRIAKAFQWHTTCKQPLLRPHCLVHGHCVIIIIINIIIIIINIIIITISVVIIIIIINIIIIAIIIISSSIIIIIIRIIMTV